MRLAEEYVMSDDYPLYEQNKFCLKSLDAQNSVFLSKLELEDSEIKLSIERVTNLLYHIQMMGLIILVGGIPITSSFFISELISPSLYLTSVGTVFSIGLPFLLLPRLLVNYKQIIFEKSISYSKNSMLSMKSFIYEYYAEHPQTDHETYKSLLLSQNALYNTSFFVLLYNLEKIYDQKRYVVSRKISMNSKNYIQKEREDTEKMLKDYGEYYSKHSKESLYVELADILKPVLHIMDGLGIDYHNSSDVK